uniref:L1 transposable element RRM domain-containing protein n=1 Tax=Seriola lalandi dorsalis TaxID=1841481 RepID=A0A3B4X6F3_SERLL
MTERLDKIEDSLKGVKEQIRGCERRLDEAEQRVSNTEDNGARADRLLTYMIRKQRCLEAHCEDIENRSRRSNLRIYGVKEGAEGGENMLDFTARLLKVALKLPDNDDLAIERAHRSLAAKPINTNISRSIVVKFLHFQTKQRILYKGWNTKELQFEGSRITLDHDYSTALQRRRKEYGEIKRQLKERNIRFRSSYPAVLRVTLDGGEKSFNSAWEAADQLKHLGITAKLSEAELMEKELHRRGWTAPLHGFTNE